jgi:hypothetical protein
MLCILSIETMNISKACTLIARINNKHIKLLNAFNINGKLSLKSPQY